LVGAQSIALRESLGFPAEQCSALRLPTSFAEVSIGDNIQLHTILANSVDKGELKFKLPTLILTT
jgi:hypothetical protein